MSVYIDVWHRTHPLSRESHRRFLDYYGSAVVGPPSDFFEVVAGFRYTDGPTNEDFALYRYDSMATIEASMMSFGSDPEFIAATETLFSDIEIEETRGIAIHLPHSSDDRIDQAIAESAGTGGVPRHFLRSVRTCSGTRRPEAFEALAAVASGVEKAGAARLVAGFQYLVGPVMDLVEIWCLGTDLADLDLRRAGVPTRLLERLDEIAPERERRGLAPTDFSRLR